MDTFIENTTHFGTFLKKVSKNQKFIYASSGTVYGNGVCIKETERVNPSNYYDASKASNDILANASDKWYYALRLGSVYGDSPRKRNDLIVNAMIQSAKTTGIIKVGNGDCKRSILDIRLLSFFIDFLICKGEYSQRGIYNVASSSGTILDIARRVQKKYGGVLKRAQTTEFKDKFKYDFTLDVTKMYTVFDLKEVPDLSQGTL